MALKEEIIALGILVDKITEDNKKLLKEKKNLEVTIETMSNEILTKKSTIVKFMKILAESSKPKTDKGTGAVQNKSASLHIIEEQVMKLFYQLQRNCFATLLEKYKSRIDFLHGLQKDLKVSYIIIKKLDIKEEFLKSKKIVESISFFENLKNLSKIGGLNYHNLRTCGPIMIFRISIDSTFGEIKEKCCNIWSMNSATYGLYDDSFNNLECCIDSNVNEFFYSYSPTDKTFGPGQVCFYIMERLKDQKELLNLQEKSIDSKAESADDGGGKSGSGGGANSFENCISLMENGKILKGINNFKVEKFEANKQYIDMCKMVDNNCFFVFISIGLLLISLFATASEKNIFYWSYANVQNNIWMNSVPLNNSTDIYDLLTYITNFVNPYDKFAVINVSTGFKYYGIIRYRFFRTKSISCIPSFGNNSIIANYTKNVPINCYSNDHNSNTWNKTGILSYKFVNKTQTNTSHIIQTPYGTLDEGGIVIDLNLNDPATFNNTMNDIMFISDRNNDFLPYSIQAIELNFNIYDPSLNVFINNLIVIQRDSNQNPHISVAESIPYLTNIYGSDANQSLQMINFIRLILTIVLLLTIPGRIAQKYFTNDKTKRSLLLFLKIVVTVFLQFKNILIIVSFLLLYNSTSNFSVAIDTAGYNNAYSFIDLYSFAQAQKFARNYNLLSIFIIAIYTLKYLQYVESINVILIAFKKAAFEYFTLIATITIILLGLSILTNFVYGSYIFEYKNFLDSFIMNLKIFIFIENTSVTFQFLQIYRGFSIILLIIFIFFLRYFLLNLFYPIFIEYYRIEVNNHYYGAKDSNEEKLTFLEMLCYFICPFRTQQRKKKVEGLVINNNFDIA